MIDEKKLIEELMEMPYVSMEDPFDDVCERADYVKRDAVVETIESQPPADQWIPCNYAVPINKLSGICDDIYIKRASGEVVQGCYWTGEQYWWGLVGGTWTKIDDAITWKPFSPAEPYKEE